eukprot:RCo044979
MTSLEDDHESQLKASRPVGLLERVRRQLWGDLPREEYRKIAMLSLTFMFIVGTYWLLRTQKDALFMKITGAANIPKAKMLSFVVMIPLILGYSKLVDLLEKHRIFYVVCGAYGILFFFVAIALSVPGLGVDDALPASPDRLLGWLIYVSIESFGSLCVPMFWSFVNSIFDLNTARSGFGLITWGAQFGSIMGPTIGRNAKFLGMPMLMFMGSMGSFVVPFLVAWFVSVHPRCREGVLQQTQQTSMAQGLVLLFRYKYLLGVFGIATFFEIIGTVLDYQFKFQLNNEFRKASEVAAFMGSFGQWANGLTFVFALFGTGFFINTLGLTGCLVMFPVTLAVVVMYVWGHSSVHALFYAMVIVKGLSYALNAPCKEILYIPTTKDVKFKAKSWIDMFGGRAAKFVGSLINSQFKTTAALTLYTGPINLTIVAVWIAVAYATGRTNQRLVEQNGLLRQGPADPCSPPPTQSL